MQAPTQAQGQQNEPQVTLHYIGGGYDFIPQASPNVLFVTRPLSALTTINQYEQYVSQLAAFRPSDVAQSQAWTSQIAIVLSELTSWYYGLASEERQKYALDQIRRYTETRLVPTIMEGLTVSQRANLATQGANTTQMMFAKAIDTMGVSGDTRELLLNIFKQQYQGNPMLYNYFQRKNAEVFQDAVQGVGVSQQHNVLQRAYQGVKEVFDFDRDVLHQRYKGRRNEAYKQKKALEKATEKVITVFRVPSNEASFQFEDFFVKGYSVYVRAKNGANANYIFDDNVEERSIAFVIQTVEDATKDIKMANGSTVKIAFNQKDVNLFRHVKFDEARGVSFKPRAYPYILKRIGAQLFESVYSMIQDADATKATYTPTDRVDWGKPFPLVTIKPPKLRIDFSGYQPGEEFIITYYRFDTDVFNQAINTTIKGDTLAQKYYYALHLVNQANYQYEKIKQRLAQARKYKLLRNDEKLMKGVMQYWGYQQPGKTAREVRRGIAGDVAAVQGLQTQALGQEPAQQ